MQNEQDTKLTKEFEDVWAWLLLIGPVLILVVEYLAESGQYDTAAKLAIFWLIIMLENLKLYRESNAKK